MDLFLQQIANGLVAGSTYAIVATGFALVFTVMRVVNLAHPDVMMLATFATIGVTTYVSRSVAVVIPIVVAMGAVVGLAVERVVLRPLRGRTLLMPLIATAGLSFLLEHGVAGVWGADPRPFPALVPRATITIGSVSLSLAQLVSVAVAAVMMIAVSVYVRRTRWGRATRALGENADVAAAFGVDVNRISQITVALSAAMAAIAGLALGALYQITTPYLALTYTVKAFICMLVAGNRHIEGVIVVALALGVVESLVTAYLTSTLKDAVAFGILVVVLYLRPRGVFGSYGTVE
jgi:branched-chain amino acid transport system permease protein